MLKEGWGGGGKRRRERETRKSRERGRVGRKEGEEKKNISIKDNELHVLSHLLISTSNRIPDRCCNTIEP